MKKINYYNFKILSKNITHIKIKSKNENLVIKYLSFDSRNIFQFSETIFFAISNNNKDGHNYIDDLYKKGCLNFVVNFSFNISKYENANFIFVENTLRAMQEIATFHRQKFKLKTIGITGSNGKTIVKEWLYQLLENDFNIVKTPQSFNSQIGVPLSIWNININNNLGIFEAGISKLNEMDNLEKLIIPEIGIFTNIGDVHRENFKSINEKLEEKLKLFKNSKILIYNNDINIESIISKINPKIKLFCWGKKENSIIRILETNFQKNHTELKLKYNNGIYNFKIQFIDTASIENIMHCISYLLLIKKDEIYINERLKELYTLPMRLSITNGINNCLLINDSYSNDINSLQIAFQYLQKRENFKKKTIILSDISNLKNYKDLIKLLLPIKLEKFIGIGDNIFKVKNLFNNINSSKNYFFKNTKSFLNQIVDINLENEIILFKGGRKFEFEKIISNYTNNIHETVLEVNLKHLQYNLKYTQSLLESSTKIMVVIKAFAYGCGSIEVTKLLQNENVDYLAVAYINEGIELRKSDIKLPIMVMNCNKNDFEFLLKYKLEPEIYSFELLEDFIEFLNQKNIYSYSIHIKIDTGMNRVGFKKNQIHNLINLLIKNKLYIDIKSIFSHLSGSESKKLDLFTKFQFEEFINIVSEIEKKTNTKVIKHILNSSGIYRHSNMQLDMVRLGIGLYGIKTFVDNKIKLKNVLTFKTSIAQIKDVNKNEFIGYNCKARAKKNLKIAIIRTGYSEGYNRRFGNGVGKICIQKKLAPTIGNICMDMCMIDITNIPNVMVGDTVIIFGNTLDINKVSLWIDTIPYELITTISPRVKREYIY